MNFPLKRRKNGFVQIPEIVPHLKDAEQTALSLIIHTGSIDSVEAVVIEALSEKRILPAKLEVMEPTLESLFMEVGQMKSYLAFTHKEFVETARTYKLLIMASVFLILGMMNPITAKITPQLLKSLMPAGMEITIGEPTAMDSWAQFFKNIPQMGLIVLVIVFSGIMDQRVFPGDTG